MLEDGGAEENRKVAYDHRRGAGNVRPGSRTHFPFNDRTRGENGGAFPSGSS